MRRRNDTHWRQRPIEERVDGIDDDLYDLEHQFARVSEKLDELTEEIDEAVTTIRRALIGALSAIAVGAVMFGIGLIETLTTGG